MISNNLNYTVDWQNLLESAMLLVQISAKILRAHSAEQMDCISENETEKSREQFSPTRGSDQKAAIHRFAYAHGFSLT